MLIPSDSTDPVELLRSREHAARRARARTRGAVYGSLFLLMLFLVWSITDPLGCQTALYVFLLGLLILIKRVLR